jgi:hypothetical protein
MKIYKMTSVRKLTDIQSSDVVCECGVRLGEAVDEGLRLDFWRVCIFSEKWCVLFWVGLI